QGECGLTKNPRSLRPSGLEALGLERLEPMSFNRDQGFLRFDVAQSLPPRFPSRNIKWMAMAIRFLDRWGAWTGRGVYLLYNPPKNLFGQKTPREGAFNRYCVKFFTLSFSALELRLSGASASWGGWGDSCDEAAFLCGFRGEQHFHRCRWGRIASTDGPTFAHFSPAGRSR